LFCLPYLNKPAAEPHKTACRTAQLDRQTRTRSIAMKTLSVIGLSLLAGLAAASAYATPGGMTAKIPFEFTAGAKTLPAGEYRIVATPHRVDIQDAKGNKLAVLLANEISDRSPGPDPQLIFHCYRQQCFLSEVWSPDYEHGNLLTSHSEEALHRKEPVRSVAILGENPNPTHPNPN
jgi:hypothetical protein